MREVESKSNFTATCDRTIENLAWLANQWWMKLAAPRWHTRFVKVDYVFEVALDDGAERRCEHRVMTR